MMRLTSMTDTSNYSQPVVNGAVYNAASQLTALNYYDATETRAYNSLMQLTNITTNDTYLPSSKINITYNYTAGSNNGKIGSATDAISGETVSYQYDSLNRLISASGSGWTQTQAYDGFGNLTGRTGTGTAQGTTISTPTNATTNQLSGYSYDANGNLISTGYAYDPENRISSVNAGALLYFYDAQNKRIWELPCQPSLCSTGNWAPQGQTINLFGADGKQLASYSLGDTVVNNQVTVTFGVLAVRSYFGGRLVGQQLGANIYEPVIQDRLGSVGKYYPYGEERNSPQLPNDQVKFATYTRDSATGNDYADQRYYTSTLGRFMSADPYRASTDSKQPQSFDRYGFVWGDPINGADPTGLCTLEGVQYPDGLPPCPDTTSTTVNGDPEPVPLNVTLNAASGNPTNSGGFTKPIWQPCPSGFIRDSYGNCISVATSWKLTLPGTNWCGPGGNGPILDGVDLVCYVHDACYVEAGATYANNFPGLSWLLNTPTLINAMNACNQQLCQGLVALGASSPVPPSELLDIEIVFAYFSCPGQP